ncbi:hypothetical protein CBL_04778 [Carabus blaptoides fortunei]
MYKEHPKIRNQQQDDNDHVDVSEYAEYLLCYHGTVNNNPQREPGVREYTPQSMSFGNNTTEDCETRVRILLPCVFNYTLAMPADAPSRLSSTSLSSSAPGDDVLAPHTTMLAAAYRKKRILEKVLATPLYRDTSVENLCLRPPALGNTEEGLPNVLSFWHSLPQDIINLNSTRAPAAADVSEWQRPLSELQGTVNSCLEADHSICARALKN